MTDLTRLIKNALTVNSKIVQASMLSELLEQVIHGAILANMRPYDVIQRFEGAVHNMEKQDWGRKTQVKVFAEIDRDVNVRYRKAGSR